MKGGKRREGGREGGREGWRDEWREGRREGGNKERREQGINAIRVG